MNIIEASYLTFFGTIIALFLLHWLHRLGWLQPLQRLRNLTRRVLGVAAFEEKVRDNLYEYRRDVNNWTRDTHPRTQRNANAIASVREDVATRMAADRTRNNRVRTEVEEMGILLRQYTDALGPMWTTAQGHKMPLRLLSTGHLTNIRDGGFTRNRNVQEFIESELERRRIDAGYRVGDAAGKPAPTRADYARGPADPRLPMIYTSEVARRVRVLPQWLQVIIRDLLTTSPQKLKRAERTRLKRMPIWAQQLVIDLEQPR